VIAHIPDTNYWHYCLQLNTYKAVLERCYGKRVTDLFLVCLHPDNKNGSYQCIRVVDMQAEVAALFEKEQEKVTKKILNHK
jgi:Cys-tRNA synthase (O-phospho-L-seryl-tRNA:Cys-tRNA synthase)